MNFSYFLHIVLQYLQDFNLNNDMATSIMRFIFLEKVFLRLHEKVLELFKKYFTREYKHLRPEVQAILNVPLEISS